MNPTLQLPRPGEHVVFVGTTGSGKTYLASKLLSYVERSIVFDTHGTVPVEGSVKVDHPGAVAWNLRWYHRIRYVPKLEYRTREHWNQVVKFLLTRNLGKKRVIYIDEIFHLGFGPSFPDWLSRGISTARQRQTSFWISSQRPMNIPMAVMTEASRIYAFYLSYEDDIKKLSKFVRDSKAFQEVMLGLKYDYSFVEIDRIKGTWRKLPKLGGG